MKEIGLLRNGCCCDLDMPLRSSRALASERANDSNAIGQSSRDLNRRRDAFLDELGR